MAAGAAALLAGLAAGWIALRPTPHPPELRGRWATAAPAYAGRWFQISPGLLVIETGVGGQLSYPIERVVVRDAPDRLARYEVHYRDGTVALSLRLQARSPDLAEVLLDSQPHVWTRVEER